MTLERKRIESIDVLRGLVMVIMALDHVRDALHISANVDDPLNLNTTTPILFFTRWITHYCAPIFFFLSGASIYLQSLRKTKKELSQFVLKRGLWLIFAEWTIISFGWTFNPFFNATPFATIWAIGISMVILSFLIRLPFKAVLTVGLVIVFGHNLLDIPESAPGFKPNFWWDLLHTGNFKIYEYAHQYVVVLVYPFVAWVGLMALGYCFGKLYAPEFQAARRKKLLINMGVGLLAFFVLLRFSNWYGDPHPWTTQKNTFYTILSFIKVHKYPPSLLYISMTIGVAMLFLAVIENVRNAFTRVMLVYGRTAFFYYILHIYLIHLVATVFFFANGYTMEQAIGSMQNLPFLFIIPGEGYTLWVVYIVWIGVVLALYPVCKWYDRYKRNHKEKWWLSYL